MVYLESIIVALIVLTAGAWLLRYYMRKNKADSNDPCAGGCEGCPFLESGCGNPQQRGKIIRKSDGR